MQGHRRTDEQGNAFPQAPLGRRLVYLGLDAVYLKVRDGGRIVSVPPPRAKGALKTALMTDGVAIVAHVGVQEECGRHPIDQKFAAEQSATLPPANRTATGLHPKA